MRAGQASKEGHGETESPAAVLAQLVEPCRAGGRRRYGSDGIMASKVQ